MFPFESYDFCIPPRFPDSGGYVLSEARYGDDPAPGGDDLSRAVLSCPGLEYHASFDLVETVNGYSLFIIAGIAAAHQENRSCCALVLPDFYPAQRTAG